MSVRFRPMVALVLTLAGAVLMGVSATAYLRAEWLRREAIAAPLPAIEEPARRPGRGDLIGVLDIPRLGVCDPIVEGDDAESLRRGVGHLPDTPLPWEEGNAAVAGHRDTVFRPLARIKEGDAIAVTTARGRYHYRVRETRVVEPDDLSVLQDEAVPTLTLITCYPFRFIGAAPRRFVVRAERVAAGAHHQQDCRDGSRQQRPPR